MLHGRADVAVDPERDPRVRVAEPLGGDPDVRPSLSISVAEEWRKVWNVRRGRPARLSSG